jgi:iron complex outermembrane receptor protein
MQRCFRFAVVLGAALVVAHPAIIQAQSAPGSIAGRVTLDIGGDPVHGATVVVVGARRTAVTGVDGRFEISNVPAGTYEVLAQREHFTAARQNVTVVGGQTVTADFALAITGVHEEVTVTGMAGGTATSFESFSSVTSLDSLELSKERGATITDALANQPGIAVRSFGVGNARPIIRGFDGDRVLIMQDGVRTGDLSSQSGDHGVTIDPASLERLEVVKGPATLLYGSNAIGGVVNAITPQDAFRATPFNGVLGGVSLDTGSANGQGGGSANIQFGRGAWTIWGGGGGRRTGDYDTPIGTIENSATELGNGRVGIGWVGNRAFFSVGGQFERSRFGVPFAGEFHAHHGEEEEHVEGEEEEEHLDIDLKTNRDELRVDTGLRNLQNRFLDNLKLTASATNYRHDEIEVAGGVEALGTRFDNDIATVRVELEQKRAGRLTGRLGFDWLGRDYRAAGEEALAPPTKQSAFSAFAYEEMNFGRFRVQFGGRIERTTYKPGERPESVHDHEGEEHEGEEHEGEEHEGEEEEHEGEEHEGEEHGEPPAVRDRDFTGASGSIGVHADIGSGGAFVANFTAASRAPALEELYNFGPHVGNLAFEIGNPDLELERTTGIDLSLRGRTERASGELSFYTYNISNFVFFNFTGEEVDGLREADFLQGDSRFIGAEAKGDIHLRRGIRLNGGFSVVRATLTETDEDLPRIPPVSGRVGVDVPWRGVTFSPEVIFAAAQENVFRDEATTDGYGLFNISLTYFVVRGHATHTIALKAYNLTNEEYRLHTSFVKDLAPEIGRGVKVTYAVRFF